MTGLLGILFHWEVGLPKNEGSNYVNECFMTISSCKLEISFVHFEGDMDEDIMKMIQLMS